MDRIITNRLILRRFQSSDCGTRNECSWRLLEKAGFQREAHLRQNIYFRKDENGDPIRKDTYIYARLRPGS